MLGDMISLIVPTYNCIGFLGEMLDSVTPQLSAGVELVVVDDGSTDGTAERLAGLRDVGVEADGNVKILLREHGGVSAARNAGIDAAEGEWIAFMDCDDLLIDGFFEKCREVMKTAADLYIFSFERVEMSPGGDVLSNDPLTVPDKAYDSSSDFADDYIRSRKLLFYSACNKLYRKALLDERKVRFREGLEFGEDRLFNYDYLPAAGSVVTSSVRMFKYMQRNPDSASNRSFPGYYDTIMMLHRAKMECFLGLSKGTSDAEKKAFEEYDLSTEMKRMRSRNL